jgi:hypothetical protein
MLAIRTYHPRLLCLRSGCDPTHAQQTRNRFNDHSVTYVFVCARMSGCHIRIPLSRTPSPFCGTCSSLSCRSVLSSYPSLYCSDILANGVYLDVGSTGLSPLCEDLWQTGEATVATACTVNRLLGTDAVGVVFITRTNMGTWAWPASAIYRGRRPSIHKPCG